MGKDSRLGFGNFETSEWIASRKNFLKNNGKISLGKDSTIAAGYRILCNGEISIGYNSYINPNCELNISYKLTIGNDCAIAWGLKIIDDDQHKITGSGKPMPNSINIGNHVWIGMNVTILKGVTIGDNAVIAAGSVVVNNIPGNALAAGVPAVVVKAIYGWE